ncbi:MAG: hypothetical protein HQL16_01575 [Candidatus Omnitrophica bacterium]|nr:hypothetical protein [Candidatus Omnitrophota bacterium]
MPSSQKPLPVSLPDAVSWSIKLYASRFQLFLLLVVTASLPGIIFQVASLVNSDQLNTILVLLWLLSVGVSIVFTTALIIAIMNTAEQKTAQASFADFLSLSLRKFWFFLGAAILAVLPQAILFKIVDALSLRAEHASLGLAFFILVFSLFAIVFAVYITIVFSMFPFVIIETHLAPVAALRKSFELIHGAFWGVTGALMLAFVILLAVALPFFVGFSLMGVPKPVMSVALNAVGMVLLPFLLGYYYRIYLALKERGNTISIAVYENMGN